MSVQRVRDTEGYLLEFSPLAHDRIEVEIRDPNTGASAQVTVPAHQTVRAVIGAATEALDMGRPEPPATGGAHDPDSVAVGPARDHDSDRAPEEKD